MTPATVLNLHIVTRVAAGAQWLDRVDPGWWRVGQPGHGDGGPIDLDNLSMASHRYCVLGQRWGSFWAAPITVNEAVRYGFDSLVGATGGDWQGTWQDDVDAELALLGVAWRDLIRQRRRAAVLALAVLGRVRRELAAMNAGQLARRAAEYAALPASEVAATLRHLVECQQEITTLADAGRIGGTR